MKNHKSRIPNAPKKFDSYINDTADNVELLDLPTVQTRFNWTDEEANAWTADRKKWLIDLYPQYTNKNKSTTVVKGDVKTFIKEFHKKNNILLSRAAASSGSTSADEALYDFVKVRATPVHQSEPIKTQVYAVITQLGGGNMQFRCRTETDGKRSRIPIEVGADSIQIAYKVGIAPLNEEDGTTKYLSSKAMFVLSLGTDSEEKKLYVYMRWYNTKHPELAAPWGKAVTVIIL